MGSCLFRRPHQKAVVAKVLLQVLVGFSRGEEVIQAWRSEKEDAKVGTVVAVGAASEAMRQSISGIRHRARFAGSARYREMQRLHSLRRV